MTTSCVTSHSLLLAASDLRRHPAANHCSYLTLEFADARLVRIVADNAFDSRLIPLALFWL